MSKKAAKLCENIDPAIKPLAETLAEAILAMQEKITEQTPIYAEMPLAQQVRVGTGESMLRSNPAVVEYRATVRDYASALKEFKNIIEENETHEAGPTMVEDLRKKYKIV